MLRNVDVDGRCSEPQVREHPCATREGTPLHIRHCFLRRHEWTAVFLLQREAGNVQPQREGIERDIRNAAMNAKLRVRPLRQLTLGKPRQQNKSGGGVHTEQRQHDNRRDECNPR